MQSLIQHLYIFFAHLGAFGLVLLGILDSSFLMMPLGNDLLLVGLTSQNPKHLIYYIPMAVIGSTLGVLLLDLVLRGTGEEGLKKRISARRVEYLKRKVSDRAGWAVALAAIAPPPFPFTPVIAAASAFNYPRWKLLSVIAGTRLVRFIIIGFLAVRFGQHILTLAKAPAFVWAMAGFIAVCIIGSAYSIYNWFYRSRRK